MLRVSRCRVGGMEDRETRERLEAGQEPDRTNSIIISASSLQPSILLLSSQTSRILSSAALQFAALVSSSLVSPHGRCSRELGRCSVGILYLRFNARFRPATTYFPRPDSGDLISSPLPLQTLDHCGSQRNALSWQLHL